MILSEFVGFIRVNAPSSCVIEVQGSITYISGPWSYVNKSDVYATLNSGVFVVCAFLAANRQNLATVNSIFFILYLRNLISL